MASSITASVADSRSSLAVIVRALRFVVGAAVHYAWGLVVKRMGGNWTIGNSSGSGRPVSRMMSMPNRKYSVAGGVESVSIL
jgi:ABC-type tungstate transport system substrate-binding protein